MPSRDAGNGRICGVHKWPDLTRPPRMGEDWQRRRAGTGRPGGSRYAPAQAVASRQRRRSGLCSLPSQQRARVCESPANRRLRSLPRAVPENLRHASVVLSDDATRHVAEVAERGVVSFAKRLTSSRPEKPARTRRRCAADPRPRVRLDSTPSMTTRASPSRPGRRLRGGCASGTNISCPPSFCLRTACSRP